MKSGVGDITRDASESTSRRLVDSICDQFEDAWKQSEHPEITQYLNSTTADLRPRLVVELVRLDREYRIRSGQTVELQDYLNAFPSLHDSLSGLADEFEVELPVLPRRRVFARGDRVGGYLLIDLIASGGFGDVWKARDPQLQRDVAVKIGRSSLQRHVPNALLAREAQAVARLDHPGIVRVLATGEEDGVQFIAMDFVAGQTLQDWLRVQKLSADAAARLCARIADAVQHAHERGIVHRDLKPANVLMDLAGNPHVTDFGLAKQSDRDSTLGQEGGILGSIAYISPEVASGRSRDVDAKSDVYALGVMLYELLSGAPPFTGDLADVLRQVRETEPAPLRRRRPELSPDLEKICLKAIAKRPADRYASARELAADLERYLNRQPVLARPISLPTRLARWCHRQRVALLVGILLFTGGGAVAAVAFGVLNDDRIRVRLQTDPPGATLTIVPLDRRTRTPVPAALTRSRSPADIRLPAGDYLMVADLGDGRFHEVFRKVPAPGDVPQVEHLFHKTWKVDGWGIVNLPPIRIPQKAAADSMVRISGSRDFAAGFPLAPIHFAVPEFELDPFELTVAEFRQLTGLPLAPAAAELPPDYALPVTWDNAIRYAELLGKRLPDEIEYQYAATFGGQRTYPWGDDLPVDALNALQPSPVGVPEWDRLPTRPPVYGLCSNLPEWTSTAGMGLLIHPMPPMVLPPGNLRPEDRADPLQLGGGLTNQRVVGGGVVQAQNQPATLPFPRASTASLETDLKGLRLVRSARPRLNPEDFVTRLRQPGDGEAGFH